MNLVFDDIHRLTKSTVGMTERGRIHEDPEEQHADFVQIYRVAFSLTGDCRNRPSMQGAQLESHDREIKALRRDTDIACSLNASQRTTPGGRVSNPPGEHCCERAWPIRQDGLYVLSVTFLKKKRNSSVHFQGRLPQNHAMPSITLER